MPLLKAPHLFARRPYWAARFGTAPFLPTSREEMDTLGWDSCDIVIVTGDAYIDHPSFGMAIVGRLLEAQGFRVGIVAQPDWTDATDFAALGRPNLFFGVTSGNMDSMVNRYTADRKIRSDDAYTPGGQAGKRPDRAVLAYAHRCREAFADTPIVLGGIEASLRRFAHYDYWSDTVRRSVLVDAKADLLLYGNAERALVELAHRLAAGEAMENIRDLRGTAFTVSSIPEGWIEVDTTRPGPPVHTPHGDELAGLPERQLHRLRRQQVLRIPSAEEVKNSPFLYAHASRTFHLESNPLNARPLLQAQGERQVWVNPPPLPLETDELDRVFDLPYARAPHPRYGSEKIPAWEMIRFSVNIMRGCFGGCTFCSITEHEGRIIQSRSKESVLREIEAIRDHTEGFTGVISDLGGPTANMYRLACNDKEVEAACRRLSCVHPDICPRLNTDHGPLVELYREARELPGVKKVLIGSGVRYDLALRSKEYIRELVSHHVGGYLKIAPEHTEKPVLDLMLKPGIEVYDRFRELFELYSKQAGKEQYLIPYFIAAHPGSATEDMVHLALWLKQNGFRPDQVQTFLPTPMALATTMYHTGFNPLIPLAGQMPNLARATGLKERRLQKAFLRYHDPANWPLLREALRQIGREDLIGPERRQLVPGDRPPPRRPSPPRQPRRRR